MLEWPETLTIGGQLNKELVGKTVRRVLPPTKEHKFCWYCGDPAEYDAKLAGRAVTRAEGFGIYAEISFEGGMKLGINDGTNVRLTRSDALPKGYQLAILFTDDSAIVFTVAMYGGIMLYRDALDNEYYVKSRNAVSPFDKEFPAYYHLTFAQTKQTLSAKAFLATEQRFPGIGNGVLQDILFTARVHPKRKIFTLSPEERDALLASVQTVLRKMTDLGGRDTERDLYGAAGGYQTIMSKNGMARGCPACGSEIVKEAYLGGSVYYSPECQLLT